MNAETYTRAVLTVIAVCLVWICVRDVTLVKPANAQAATAVRVLNWPETQDVNVTRSVGLLVENWPATQEVSVSHSVDVVVENWPEVEMPSTAE